MSAKYPVNGVFPLTGIKALPKRLISMGLAFGRPVEFFLSQKRFFIAHLTRQGLRIIEQTSAGFYFFKRSEKKRNASRLRNDSSNPKVPFPSSAHSHPEAPFHPSAEPSLFYQPHALRLYDFCLKTAVRSPRKSA